MQKLADSGDPPALAAQGLTFSHDGREFLRVERLALRAGTLSGLLGPNGAGKSTLLRLLCGLGRPTAGSVQAAGAELRSLDSTSRARQIAWVPQRSETPFELTVREMVEAGRLPYSRLRLDTRPEDARAVEDAIQSVGLGGMEARLLPTLSGGEWQRAVIARALAQNPRVLLLDEPVANLDLKYQREVYELLHRLCRERRVAVLTADHHIDLQAHYCDELFLLDRGKLRAQGSPSEVVGAPLLSEVFGTPLRVRIDPASGRPRVEWEFEAARAEAGR